MKVSLLVAYSINKVIGKEGKIPWHIPADLGRFKKLTSGKPVIMGRKTYESLPAKVRPLPGRLNLVLTRNKKLLRNKDCPEGMLYVPSITKALKHCEKAGIEEVFIIGGEKVYEKGIPFCDTLYITHVLDWIDDGDAFFPELDFINWRLIDESGSQVDSKCQNEWEYLTFERVGEKAPMDFLSKFLRFFGGG